VIFYLKELKPISEIEEMKSCNGQFDENFIDPKELYHEIPTIGNGIDFASRTKPEKEKSESISNIDLTSAILNTSFDESLLNTSTQSYFEESFVSISQAEHDISELLAINENEEINEIFTKKSESGSSSGSSTPSIDDLINKRKVKKYAIEADLKLTKSFDEIKPKLAHQVETFFFINKFFNLNLKFNY